MYGFLRELKKEDDQQLQQQQKSTSSGLVVNNDTTLGVLDYSQSTGAAAAAAAAADPRSRSKMSERARSLEDILHNLKKYRTKFSTESNRCSRCRGGDLDGQTETSTMRYRREDAGSKSVNLSRRRSKQQQQDQFTCTSLDKEGMYRAMESSTWRVMRHLRSADIRNKYPLPQANPDYHFRNSTVFVTAGRPPKATFLLHPDWV